MILNQGAGILESPRGLCKSFVFLRLGEVGWEEGEQVDFEKLPMILTGTVTSSPLVSLSMSLQVATGCLVL